MGISQEMLRERMLEGDSGAGNGGAGNGGTAPSGTPDQGQMSQQNQPQPQKRPFDELIKGEYRSDFEAKTQRIINDRLKTHQKIQQQWDAATPVMQALAQKYGIDANDTAGIAKAFGDDEKMSETLYQEAADREGIPVQTYRQMQQLRRDQQELRSIKERQRQQEQAQQYFQGLEAQAAEMQKTIPGFNLGQELQDKRFAQLVNPVNGWSVQDAYFAVHAKELQRAGMQYAGQQAAQRIAQSVQAGAARPMENAALGQGGGRITVDPRSISYADREEINRRVRAGEKIYL